MPRFSAPRRMPAEPWSPLQARHGGTGARGGAAAGYPTVTVAAALPAFEGGPLPRRRRSGDLQALFAILAVLDDTISSSAAAQKTLASLKREAVRLSRRRRRVAEEDRARPALDFTTPASPATSRPAAPADLLAATLFLPRSRPGAIDIAILCPGQGSTVSRSSSASPKATEPADDRRPFERRSRHRPSRPRLPAAERIHANDLARPSSAPQRRETRPCCDRAGPSPHLRRLQRRRTRAMAARAGCPQETIPSLGPLRAAAMDAASIGPRGDGLDSRSSARRTWKRSFRYAPRRSHRQRRQSLRRRGSRPPSRASPARRRACARRHAARRPRRVPHVVLRPAVRASGPVRWRRARLPSACRTSPHRRDARLARVAPSAPCPPSSPKPFARIPACAASSRPDHRRRSTSAGAVSRGWCGTPSRLAVRAMSEFRTTDGSVAWVDRMLN